MFIVLLFYLTINKSIIKFFRRSLYKYRFRYKLISKGFLLYAYASYKDIIYNFILFSSRNKYEVYPKSLTLDSFIRIT